MPYEENAPGTRLPALKEIAFRAAAAAACMVFAVRAVSAFYANPTRITLLLLVASETVTLTLVLFSRLPGARDTRPLTVAFVLGASFLYPFFISVTPGIALIPEWLGSTMVGLGLCWVIYAKLSLGSRFGLLPADRGVVSSGAYRWMRHPIYFGYFVTHIGFLLSSFVPQNLAVFVCLYAAQVYRAVCEERLLRSNPDYDQYCGSVPYRFVPGLI